MVAVLQLHASGRGRSVMRDLLEFLDGDALSLDIQNQKAVFTLLSACWGGLPGSTRDCMREALAGGDVSRPQCPSCSEPALDGHITCGAAACDEGGHRRASMT